MKNAIIYTIVFALIQIFTSLTFAFVNRLMGVDGKQMTPGILIASSVVASVIIVGVFCLLRWAKPTRQYMLSRPWTVIAWSIVAAVGCVIPSMWLMEQIPELPNVSGQQLNDMMMNRGGYLAICLLAPLAEELVFRGAVLRELLAWMPERKWLMIGVSAVIFSVIHFNPAQMPYAFATGLLLGWMYERTGSIAPGIAFHWTNNTIAYLMFRAYPDPSLKLVDILSGDQCAVVFAVLFSLLIVLPAVYQLYLNMKRPSIS